MNAFWAGIFAIIGGVVIIWISTVADIPEIDLLFLIISIILWIGGAIAIITSLR